MFLLAEVFQWATTLHIRAGDPPIRRGSGFGDVAARLFNQFGIICVGCLGFKNTPCLAMRRQQANQPGIRRIGGPGFFGRPGWIPVRDRDRLGEPETRGPNAALMEQAVRDGQVDLISGFSTDSCIAAYDLTLPDEPGSSSTCQAGSSIPERFCPGRP